MRLKARRVQVVTAIAGVLLAAAGFVTLTAWIEVDGSHFCGTAFSLTTGKDWALPGAGDGEPDRPPPSQAFLDQCHAAAQTHAWVGYGVLGLGLALMLVAVWIAIVRMSRWFVTTRTYYPTT